MDKILLSEPYFDKKDLNSLKNPIKTSWVSTAGKQISTFEKNVSRLTKSKFCIACNSGTSALHIALKVLGINKKHEVIAPSITFIATINAIKYNDAAPIFMDVDDSFNIDEDKTIQFLEKNTEIKNGNCVNKKTKKIIKALIVAHIWGNGANIRKLISVCRKKNIKIIEDAAESLGTYYKKTYLNNKHTGTIGSIGILSFNGNKIITTGAGGMILTNNKTLAKKSRYLINQAKDNDLFKHNEIGYNYKMPNLNAALGLSQIVKLKKIKKLKKRVYENYLSIFKNSKIFSVLKCDKISNNNNWMIILQLKKNINKKFLDYLIKSQIKKIQFRKVWPPNETQLIYRKYQRYKITNSYKLFDYSICSPSSAKLTYKKIEYIEKSIKKSYENFINFK